MADEVDVDLGSAVVAFRPAAGEERSVSAAALSRTELFRAAPWRTFRWYFGQRHYSGTYWSATQRDHVIYESRLELANLLLADFDVSVNQIVAQPFLVTMAINNRARRHIPDYLWDTDDGPVVVDVITSQRVFEPKVVLLTAWTRTFVESLGWTYVVLNEPAPVRLANVRFLAGYRREWLLNADVLNEMHSCSGQFAGMTVAEVEASFRAVPRALVRPALMHLLWRHEYTVDLDDSLRPSTVLESGI